MADKPSVSKNDKEGEPRDPQKNGNKSEGDQTDVKNESGVLPPTSSSPPDLKIITTGLNFSGQFEILHQEGMDAFLEAVGVSQMVRSMASGLGLRTVRKMSMKHIQPSSSSSSPSSPTRSVASKFCDDDLAIQKAGMEQLDVSVGGERVEVELEAEG